MTPACPRSGRALEPAGWDAAGIEANRIGRASTGVRLWGQSPRPGCACPGRFPRSGRLRDAGLGWRFFSSVLAIEDRPRALLRTPHVPDDRLQAIVERVRNATLPQDVVRSVSDALLAMRDEGATGFAVRSSAMHEDQEGASAAGMHSTLLNLMREDEVLDAIKACWSSVFRPRVLSYLRALGEEVPVSVGVVIQAMVPAEVSGVLFTANPLTGDAGEVVINAAYGLGASVVEGRVTPDTYRVDKNTGQLRDRIIGDKAQRTLLEGSGGVREVSVPSAEREAPALSEQELLHLTDLAIRVESHFGNARDVEWAFAEHELYVLQARPIVVPSTRSRRGSRRDRPVDRRKIVWSNANVGEALPGHAAHLVCPESVQRPRFPPGIWRHGLLRSARRRARWRFSGADLHQSDRVQRDHVADPVDPSVDSGSARGWPVRLRARRNRC